MRGEERERPVASWEKRDEEEKHDRGKAEVKRLK